MVTERIELHPPTDWEQLVSQPYSPKVSAAMELEKQLRKLTQVGMGDPDFRIAAATKVKAWAIQPVLSAWGSINKRAALPVEDMPALLSDYGVLLESRGAVLGLKLRGRTTNQKCVFRGLSTPLDTPAGKIPRVAVEWRADLDVDLKERAELGADAAIKLMCLWAVNLMPAPRVLQAFNYSDL